MNVGTRVDSNPLYRKLRTVHKDMIRRCYNKNAPVYKNYGAKGVKVAPEWHTLNGFLNSADLVDGWDKHQFLTTGLTLDKDKKSGSLYSVDTCTWLTDAENKALLSNNYRNVHAISPKGDYFYITNIDQFCREHNLGHGNIVQVLNGTQKHHKLWTFWYNGDTPREQIELHTAISPDGLVVKFYHATELVPYGLNPKGVTRCLRGERPTHKKWKFIKSKNL